MPDLVKEVAAGAVTGLHDRLRNSRLRLGRWDKGAQ